MEDDGWYYLHENGDLIWKRFEPEADSTFVKKVWRVDTTDRFSAWKIVLEAFALGGRVDRLLELSEKWKLTFEDSVELLKRTPIKAVTGLMSDGLTLFADHVLRMTPMAYWTKVREVWDDGKMDGRWNEGKAEEADRGGNPTVRNNQSVRDKPWSI